MSCEFDEVAEKIAVFSLYTHFRLLHVYDKTGTIL